MRGRAARALRFDGPPARGRRGVLAPRFAPRLARSAPRAQTTKPSQVQPFTIVILGLLQGEIIQVS